MPRMVTNLCCLLHCALTACSASHVHDDSGAHDGSATDGGPADATVAYDRSPALDSGRDGGPGISDLVLDFCLRHAALLCEGNRRCCPDARRRWPPEDCGEAEILDGCRRLAQSSAFRDGTIEWDAEAAEGRIAELEGALPSCGRIARGWAASFPAVLRGLLGAGSDCTPDAPMSLALLRCGPGLRCELTGTHDDFVGRCVPLGAEGATCIYPLGECLEGLYCSWDEPWEPDTPYLGRCAPRRDEGDPCSADHSCTTIWCDAGTDRCLVPDAPSSWCTSHG